MVLASYLHDMDRQQLFFNKDFKQEIMTGLERDYLVQLTRIADALEKQNALQEAAVASLNTPTEDQEEDNQDISELIKKLSKFK